MYKRQGYDAVVGVVCSYVATQIGFGTSWMNPFSLAVAQGIAGIPVMSGAAFRIVLWLFFTGLTIVFTMRYASTVSYTHLDVYKRQSGGSQISGRTS